MIKALLLIVATILAALGVFATFNILQGLFGFMLSNPMILVAIGLAVGVQLVGHAFRAKRTKLVLDQAASSSLQFQFGALSTGYLFNALLPLRLGEFIRAYLVAKRLRISFLYTFAAIVIERAIDIIFLSIVIIAGGLIIGGASGNSLALVAVFFILAASLLLYILLLLKNENKYLLAVVSKLSNIFNSSIGNSIRFKVWSLIFGLQSFFGNRQLVRKYIAYAIFSWVCYFFSTFIIVTSLLQITGVVQAVVASVSPYIISFNPLDASSYHQIAVLLPANAGSGNIDAYAKTAWVVLALPMAAIGFVTLLLYKTSIKHVAKKTKTDSYVNKLLRHEDISQEFPAFLDTYFKGHSLSRILHKIELTGELSLVKFFKGGSDAITVLALKDDKLFVKKIVPAQYTERLRVQYKWLKKHASKKAIVDVLDEHKTDDYYAIDLAYDPENIPLFEYIHTHSLTQSQKVIDDVWKYVFKHVYTLSEESTNEKERDVYIQERLMDKVVKAVAVNDDLTQIVDHDKIMINGEVYDNFYAIMQKIKSNKKAWNDLAVYRKSTAIHGDLTVDNILVDNRTDEPFIIDPSDDNQIRGPIIDFARHVQSLIAGYEFLNNDDEPVKASKKNGLMSINYHDRRSAKYMQLEEYVNRTLASKYLTQTEQKTVLFHTGLLYGRMLAHRVVINPHNTLKYYAVSVVLLNEFYRQYE